MSADLLRMVNGYQASQPLHAAVALGLPDLLAEGPRSTADLADACGAHEPTLRRLVRALAGLGVLHEDEDGRVSLTELGGPLRTDRPDSIAGWTRLIGRPYYWNTWAALTDAVRSGENGFRLLNGTDVWSWRADHPDESAIFDGAMTALTAQVTRAVTGSYDFSRFSAVVDVGGGRGTLLEALLAANPGMRGILFDQPHVVEGVRPHDRLEVVVIGSPVPTAAYLNQPVTA